jgi:signal transduction histidine kinase
LAEAFLSGALIVVAVVMVLVLPSRDSFSLGLAAVFVIAYAITTRVQFEVGLGVTVPTQLVFVPMLFALPPRTIPLLVVVASVLADLLDYWAGERHILRIVKAPGDAWYATGPALILALTGADDPVWADWPIYVAALAAQLTCDFAISALREWLARGVTPRPQLRALGWMHLVDLLLSPVGLLAAFASSDWRYAFLLVLPLVALFVIFARERRARIESALGLSRAYRKTAELSSKLLDSERASTRAREELIAGASHEMQTPLAVLLGLLDASARGELAPEEQTEIRSSMRRQATRLRHLVTQFTDYTRFKSGRPLSIDPRPTEIKPIVEDVADAQRGYAPIELDIADDLPLVLVDPDRLHQVLMNLVSNAVKFSPEGSASTITARALSGSVEISVVDRGAGIEADQLDYLFEEFRRGEGAGQEGAGIGLFMSRVLAEVQGCQVKVESRPGEGSSFTIVLPQATG